VKRDTEPDFLSTLTLVDIVQAAWRKRWLGSFLFLLLGGLFLTGIMLFPNRYTSSAQLLVRLGRGAVSMDPTTSLGQTVSLQESRITQVNSVVQLLSSREMRERVAKRVGPERILKPTGTLAIATDRVMHCIKLLAGMIASPQPNVPEDGLSAQEIEQLKRLGEACEVIEDGYVVHSPEDSYTIGIDFFGHSPLLARDVVAAFVQEYPDYHVQAHHSSGSLAFFEQEARTALETANAAQQAAGKLKARHGIIELESSKSALQDELNQVERSINHNKVQLARVQAELTQLQAAMTAMPNTIESETVKGISKHSGDLIRDRFFDLELQAEELSTKLKPDHPKLTALHAQLAASRAIADQEIGQEPQVTEVINPNLQEIDLSARTAMAQRAGLIAEQEVLQEQFDRVRSDLLQLNEVGAELTKLSWDADVAESMYRRTADRLANARQIAALEQQQLSDVSIAQDATLEMKKVGPNRPLLAMIGLALSAALSFCLAALSGLSQTSRQFQMREQLRIASLLATPPGRSANRRPSETMPSYDDASTTNLPVPDVHDGHGFVSSDVVAD
tara:strand:- start:58094 stop:59779 length:1686 start_codon:yes stop_codon:yes gene_type:complete